ncbi:unnamed protein product, partial [Porites evermanni]
SCTDGNVNAKRNLYQFHKMIECSTNLSSYHYHDYGCYCGYGGGGNAVDETDMCCKIHDACYEAISNHPNLCSFESSVYWKIYSRDNSCTGCSKFSNHVRYRRSLYQFYQMISCATNNNPLKYNKYGCFCGLGGQGTPVDNLDRCCQKHDSCYRQINLDKRCRFPWYIYVKSYERKDCTGCGMMW